MRLWPCLTQVACYCCCWIWHWTDLIHFECRSPENWMPCFSWSEGISNKWTLLIQKLKLIKASKCCSQLGSLLWHLKFTLWHHSESPCWIVASQGIRQWTWFLTIKGVPSAESSRSVWGLGKGVSGKPYPRLCNARRPRLEPGTFWSQAVRLYHLHLVPYYGI